MQVRRNDAPHGIHHRVQFRLVDIIAADDQGDGPVRHRIDDGTETLLLAEEDQVRMRFRDDGHAPVFIDDLDQRADAAAFEEPFIRNGSSFPVSRVQAWSKC